MAGTQGCCSLPLQRKKRTNAQVNRSGCNPASENEAAVAGDRDRDSADLSRVQFNYYPSGYVYRVHCR